MKTVTVEELVANIEAYLAAVIQGEMLTVINDGKAVATLEPAGLKIRPPDPTKPPFREFRFDPRPEGLSTEGVDLLMEEREYERSNARISPPGGLTLPQPASGKRPGDFVPGPPPKDLKTDAVELLIEDRESELKKHGS